MEHNDIRSLLRHLRRVGSRLRTRYLMMRAELFDGLDAMLRGRIAAVLISGDVPLALRTICSTRH